MTQQPLRLGSLKLDLGRLRLEGGSDAVPLRPKSFDVLRYLVENTGRVVAKDELINAVWPGVTVTDESLTQCISEVRRAIGDADKQIIKTIPRRGYMAEAPRPVGQTRLVSEGRPSIAVLPFRNLSGSPSYGHFADGLVEGIIASLLQVGWISLVAPTAGACKAQAVDVRLVERELGVRWVMLGSLRASDRWIRVSAQLIETSTGKHLWAGRYDRQLGDIFAVQDEVAAAVTTGVVPTIAVAEQQQAMRESPEQLDAWGAYQRGLWHLGTGRSGDNGIAADFFGKAIRLDPNLAGGYAGLAYARIHATNQTRSFGEMLPLAESLARRAVAIDPRDAEARSCFGLTLHLRGNSDNGRTEVERALAINPNLAVAHGILGETLIFSGQARNGMSALETATTLDPLYPNSRVHLYLKAAAMYLMREYEAACGIAERVIQSYPDYPPTYRWLAAALGQLGRQQEARRALNKAINVAPASFGRFARGSAPWKRAQDHDHMQDGLRKAGWQG